MLVVFFVRIGIDIGHWFRVMPGLVEKQNEKLAEDAASGRAIEKLIKEDMRQIDVEMQETLAQTPDEKGKEAVRRRYERIRQGSKQQMEQKAQDLIRAEEGIRPDTSPSALLWHFFTQSPSSNPQDVGIMPALMGSILLGLITLACAVPLGVGAAIYLEEYRSASRLARFIQLNINNLAGVPSIVYGVLGTYVFVELIFKPLESDTIAARNVIGGGMTLAMLTLPVIIIAAQEAIRTVPSSLRHAAFALGATRWQVIRNVVLPAGMPGIMTGIILAMSRALGEAAPLVFFGALLFVNHDPTLFSRFTILPMQIFGWASRPQEVFLYNAALASAVLL
ncbi:phosphate ABC transporter, permease protein PstA, partial [Tannerella sp. oral taxon 808]